MFSAALFVIAKKWKQPKCPSISEWLTKLWYIHTMNYYSAIKQNIVVIHAPKWINLKGIIPSKKTVFKGYILCSSIYMIFSKMQLCSDGEQTSDCQGHDYTYSHKHTYI